MSWTPTYTQCTVSGCRRAHKALGMCSGHYEAERKRRSKRKPQAYRSMLARLESDHVRMGRAARQDAAEEELLSHPATMRLKELLSLPCYQYDPSPDVQSHVIDCIESIPRHLRNAAFAMRYYRDPLWPVASEIDFHKRMGGSGDGSSFAIAWIYGLTRQRIDQIERAAAASLRSDRIIKMMVREINEPADRFIRGVSGRGDNT